MKKTLLFLAIIFSVSLMAQQNSPDGIFTGKVKKEKIHTTKSAPPIWSEDFGNGFPSGWSTYTNNAAGGMATCPWKHSFVGSWGYWNTNQGASAASAMNSTTASNGFLISDPDSANHWNYGQPSGSTYEYMESYFTTSAIDLSAYANVSLEFQQTFRFNNGLNLKVSISTDSIMWTDYNVQGNATNNTQSPDPQFVSLNISSVAGNSSTVYVRIGWEARVYYWMIDDMQIVETPANKIELLDETFGGWILSSPTTTGDMGIPYTFNPILQATANPYRVEGRIINQGGTNQSNTQLNVNVRDDINMSVFSDNSTPVILNVSDTITVGTINTFSPTNIGKYDFDIWASSDSVLTDTATRRSIVTDTVYGRDYDWNTDGTNAGSGYYLGRHNCGQILANAFEIYAPDTVTSISFFVDDQSVINSFLRVELYEYDPTQSLNSGAPPVWLESSDDYALTSADIGSWVTLKLNSPVSVFPGIPGTGSTAYLAAVYGYAHPIDTTLISSSGSDGVVSFIQDNGCNIGSGGFGYWYSAAKTLMIRMNLGNVSITSFINEDSFAKNITVYPNPTSDKITIDINNNKAENITISLTNVLGQEVFVRQQSVAINAKEVIDIAAFAKGVYVLEIQQNEKSYLQKIVVE